MKKTTITVILLGLLLLTQCKSPSDSDNTVDIDPDLTGSLSTICVLDAPGSSVIDMTFGADGSFYRRKRSWSDGACSSGLTTDEFTKTYSAKGPSAGDPTIKQLQYLNGSDSTIYAIYRIITGTLSFKDDPAAYPADLTGAIDFK